MTKLAQGSVADAAARCKAASRTLAFTDSKTKDSVLRALASMLRDRSAEVLAANAEDMAAARENDVGDAKLRRLELTEASHGTTSPRGSSRSPRCPTRSA
jgi:glutamate-5-semialdehyde dehydrogenase